MEIKIAEDRELFAAVDLTLKKGIHTREELVEALRLRKELKRAQDAKFNRLTALNIALSRLEGLTHTCVELLETPLHPVAPNIRRGSVTVDGKKLSLVETTIIEGDQERVIRLWVRDYDW